ncbi:carbohydrate binding domain-containing protein [Lederbergia panacisoli]|uniref:carbohydrate binding domain-containing protein n=1 Tax=Lederbergia panacisoli TaxID=1255251 RepID=UPI00214C70EB|nr:carbohydrate binding domain-containing protein [Lederbergia panacisoli]MCR2823116.1 carbohydrate binding domain-containing protein [Lederbergia panacisoli]
MSKKWWSLSMVFLLFFSNFFSLNVKANETNEEPPSEDSDWSLVWEDNFDGNELDTTKWSIDTGNGFENPDGSWNPGWGNNELQYYDENNVKIENGKLILEGRKESISDNHGTYQYTSGKILSRGKFSKKYGKIEAKMKLPKGKGFWPAFWMMPEDDVYGGWAASGEIDIMEGKGSIPNKVGGAIHYGGGWPNNTYTAKDYEFSSGDITDFNVYSLEWEPGELRWYVNGELYQKLNNWNSTGTGNAAKYSYPAPFDQEFFIILNLAIGGHFDGNPDGSTEFPGQVEVDYVRVYELTGRDYLQPVEPGFDVEELPDNAKKAIDGNYIYDNAFEKGFTTITNSSELDNKWDYMNWNLVYMNDFAGNASASVENLDGTPFAKVNINQPGSQSYSVQLIQNVTLGKGRWYKLSFDAKSNANRNVNLKFGGGPERGYTAYAPTPDFALTNDVQSYEMKFQMQHDTDAAARLEFNMGLNANTVWIGNAVLEEIDPVDPYNEDAPKKPLSNGNHIYNGTFDQGRLDRMTYWNLHTDGAVAKASVDPDKRELKVEITDGGSSNQAIKVVQKGLNLLSNDEYELTFNARAESLKDIQVALLNEDGTVNFSGSQRISLTTAMEEKTLRFTMPDVTDVKGQLVFLLGGNNSHVYLDDVKLIRLTNKNDQLTLNDIFPLKNGDFSKELEHWTKHIQGDFDGHGSSGTLQVEDGQAKFTIRNVGYNPWDLMLIQEGMNLKKGNTYVVQFDAKSTVDRTMEIVVENASYTRFFNEKIQLNNTMETFQFEFKMNTDEAVGLKYLLGNIAGASAINEAHNVFIDNVRFEIKGEREKHFPLKNGDFSNDLSSWNRHVQGDYDGNSKATMEAVNGEAKVSVQNVGTNPWDVQLHQSGLALMEGKTYVVSFDARSTIDRLLEVVIDNGDPAYYRYFEETVQLTDSAKTYSFEFKMTSDDMTKFQFLVGNVGGQQLTIPHDVFIDNVRLEVKGAREALEDGADDNEPTDPTDPPEEKKWKEIGENLVIDGTFDTTKEFGTAPDQLVDGWNIFNMGNHVDFAGLADFSVENGQLHANVKQVGWNWYDIQLLQNLNVPSGTYKIQFDMSSEQERPVYVELAGSGVKTFNVTNVMKTYEVIVDAHSDGVKQFMLGLGRNSGDVEPSVPYTIVIDNVKLVKVEEVTDDEPTDPTDPPEQKKDQVDADFRMNGNNAVISDADFESLLDEMKNEGTVVINLANNKDNTFVRLSERQAELLKEKSAKVQVNLNDDVILSIPSQIFKNEKGKVEISIKKEKAVNGAVSSVYNLEMKQGGHTITDFDKLNVTISFKVEKGSDNLSVYFKAKNDWVKLGGTYNKGLVTVETDHFSSFAVFVNAPTNKKK